MKLLNKIQQEIKAPKTQKNTHGGYMYRSCSDILSAVKPFLSDGVAFLHMTDRLVDVGGRNYVEATVTLTQGSEKITALGYAREADDQKGMNAGQLSCSTSSYARKVALSGLLAIDDSHDAGNGKGAGPKPKTKKALIAEAHGNYVNEHRADIPEHFSISLGDFQDAVMTEAKKQIPVAKRKAFEWTAESIKPFVLALKITDLLVEDK